MNDTVTLKAVKGLRYATRMMTAGDTFEAKRKDARVLVAVKKAEYIETEVKADAPKTEDVKPAKPVRQTLRFNQPVQKIVEPEPETDAEVIAPVEEEAKTEDKSEDTGSDEA